jgi:hypothetical protein
MIRSKSCLSIRCEELMCNGVVAYGIGLRQSLMTRLVFIKRPALLLLFSPFGGFTLFLDLHFIYTMDMPKLEEHYSLIHYGRLFEP